MATSHCALLLRIFRPSSFFLAAPTSANTMEKKLVTRPVNRSPTERIKAETKRSVTFLFRSWARESHLLLRSIRRNHLSWLDVERVWNGRSWRCPSSFVLTLLSLSLFFYYSTRITMNKSWSPLSRLWNSIKSFVKRRILKFSLLDR